MNVLLVKDYLKFNNISHLIITERVINVIDTSESELHSLNYQNILVRLASPLSVVMNLECEIPADSWKNFRTEKSFTIKDFG